MSYKVTVLKQQKILTDHNESAKQQTNPAVVMQGAVFTSLEKVGEYFSHPSGGWVCKWKGGQIALSYTETTPPPVDPPVSEWGIVRVSLDTTQRTFDPATQPLTDDNPPRGVSTKGTPIKIMGWEPFVKKINVPSSVAWLLAIGSQWVNSADLPLRAEQLCSSCNIVHIIGANATHYKIETLYNDENTSTLDPLVWNWLKKPWLFHQALARSKKGKITLVGNGKYVYYPLLRTRAAEMWIKRGLVELLPTMLNGRPITAFRFLGASIWGMVDGVEVPLILHPTRDNLWENPDWPLQTQGAIPPA